MKKFIILILYLVHQSLAQDVIYHLDDADYYRMPVRHRFDHYEECVGLPGGAYCTANAKLVSDEPSPLLDMVTAYSAHVEKHFNYTDLIYGLCLTKTCKQFYSGDDSQAALWRSTEACLNDSLAREYELRARVYELACYHHGRGVVADAADWAVAALLLLLLALGAAGTCYHYYRDRSQPGNKYLMSFSLRSNWDKLVAPPPTDPRQAQLGPINGIRVLTTLIMIMVHIGIPPGIGSSNPSFVERSFRFTLVQFLISGHIFTLTFFSISGFLLAYHHQMKAERQKYTFRVFVDSIFTRWMRFTPVNLMVLLISISWLRHTGSQGPLWWLLVGQESRDCRENWLYHVLYINNLIDHSTCNIQAWSLAADMQLHAVGLATLLAARGARARRGALAALAALGAFLPAYHVWARDLDGTLLIGPSAIGSLFMNSPAFHYVYKRTSANLPCFVMGMAFGHFVYDLQKRDLIKGDYSSLRSAYRVTIGLMLATVPFTSYLFMGDAPRASLATRLLFAPIVKPLFGFLILLIILGAIYRVDPVISDLLSWRGWVPLSRISYCMYAVHLSLLRYLCAKPYLTYFSTMQMLQDYISVVVISAVISVALHLLVEAPFASLVKIYSTPPARPLKQSDEQNVNKAASANDLKED